MVGVEIFGFELCRFAELLFGGAEFSEARQIGGQVGARLGGIGVEAHGFFEVLVGLGVLGLGRVDQAKKFVDLEALRNAWQQLFQLDGGFGEVAGVVLGYGGLELPVEIVVWRLSLRGTTRWQRQRPRQKH